MESSKSENSRETSINSQSGFRAYHSSGRNNPKLFGNLSHSEVKSDLETVILASSEPIDLNETEEITVNGVRGIWANRNEVTNWRGNYPISKYPINEDINPKIIHKRTQQQIVYRQEVAIRYLRPPTPPAPGEILIQHQGSSLAPPAPPPPPPTVGRKGITMHYYTIQIKLTL